jgi:hypothetical protein
VRNKRQGNYKPPTEKSLANLKRWAPGVSGNPGGRPRGFARIIREYCGENFERIVEGLFLIAYGTAQQRRLYFGQQIRVTTRERLMAMIELRDSGPGRPMQRIQTGERLVPFFALPPGHERGPSIVFPGEVVEQAPAAPAALPPAATTTEAAPALQPFAAVTPNGNGNGHKTNGSNGKGNGSNGHS